MSSSKQGRSTSIQKKLRSITCFIGSIWMSFHNQSLFLRKRKKLIHQCPNIWVQTRWCNTLKTRGRRIYVDEQEKKERRKAERLAKKKKKEDLAKQKASHHDHNWGTQHWPSSSDDGLAESELSHQDPIEEPAAKDNVACLKCGEQMLMAQMVIYGWHVMCAVTSFILNVLPFTQKTIIDLVKFIGCDTCDDYYGITGV